MLLQKPNSVQYNVYCSLIISAAEAAVVQQLWRPFKNFFSSHDFWDPGNFNFMICSYPLFSSVVRSSTLSLNSILRINVTFFVSVLKIVKNICKKKSLKIVKNGKRFS